MLKCYKVKIKTLAPVHIGSGQEIQKSEYVQDRKENRIYVMDTYKMFIGLERLHLVDKYEQFVLGSQRPVLFNFVKENNIRTEVYKQWAKYSYPSVPDADFKSIIQSCMKDAYGMPYLPGSSLKGALTNALLNDMLLKNERRETAFAVQNTEFKNKNQFLKQEAEKIQTDFFYKKRDEKSKLGNAANSLMRGLIVSDSKPLSCDDIVLCPKIDLKRDGTENKLNILRESICPGTVIESTITIDTAVLPIDDKRLDFALKSMYNNMQDKFLSFFPDVQKTDKTPVYLGGGTGYIQKTALYSLIHDRDTAVKTAARIHSYLAQNHKHSEDYAKYRVSPKTRKCTIIGGKKHDMGLCEISFQPI